MDIDEFIEKVAGCLEELPVGGLSAETDFKALRGWDSLAVLTVTDTLDMDYGVLLKKTDYHACTRLVELFELVQVRAGTV